MLRRALLSLACCSLVLLLRADTKLVVKMTFSGHDRL